MGREQDGVPKFLAYQIWKVKPPPRVASFAWEASHECILTIYKLIKRAK